MQKVIKRSGKEVVFDKTKVVEAIKKANNDVDSAFRITNSQIQGAANDVERTCSGYIHPIPIEDIQDLVEDALTRRKGGSAVARSYIQYRYHHKLMREGYLDNKVEAIVEGLSQEVADENSNKNTRIIPTQRDYLAGEVSRDYSRRNIFDEDVIRAHDDGIIHIHDMDFMVHHMHNCCLVNLDDMLQNGTVISETKIDKPHTFSTACTIATQIVVQTASCQYGGQTISLAHLSKFVNETREYYKRKMPMLSLEDVERLTEIDIQKGVQTIQYQLITIATSNGQAPFVTLYMDLTEAPEGCDRDDLAKCIAEVLKQRITGVKNEQGIFVTPAFPKLIYALDECNITEDAPYWQLTKLAAKCTAKRMVPDYISTKLMKELKGDVYPCMGCRSFLTPCRNKRNYSKSNNFIPGHNYYGRFNQGVVTINLIDAALSSHGNIKKFFDIMDERTELCYRALMTRHNRLKGTKSDVAPILWQHGVLGRLKPGEVIDELLYHGYSTISLGYAGLYECTKYMTGVSHTDPNGEVFAMRVMKYLNDRCKKWKRETNIDFSLYGTPIESTTYRFAKLLQKRFGKIEGITDRNYITNSYHVPVFEKIDAFSKLAKEAPFQALSPGGAISYVEVPNLQNNLDSVLTLLQYMYDTILYSELNTKSDYCSTCGWDGEIEIVTDDSGKLIWQCPVCGETDMTKMSVARRTCGYIGLQSWNQGRTQEIKERVLHL